MLANITVFSVPAAVSGPALHPPSGIPRGIDCLDELIARGDADGLEECLIGFLAQLRNEAAANGTDRTSTWTSAVSFVTDMLRHAGIGSSVHATDIETRLLRLDALHRQLAPNPKAQAARDPGASAIGCGGSL